MKVGALARGVRKPGIRSKSALALSSWASAVKPEALALKSSGFSAEVLGFSSKAGEQRAKSFGFGAEVLGFSSKAGEQRAVVSKVGL